MKRYLIAITITMLLCGIVFSQEPEPQGDFDCSGEVDISDLVSLVDLIFLDGNQPCNCAYIIKDTVENLNIGSSIIFNRSNFSTDLWNENRTNLFSINVNPETDGILRILLTGDIELIMDTCGVYTTYLLMDTVARGINDTIGMASSIINKGYVWNSCQCENVWGANCSGCKIGLNYGFPVTATPVNLFFDIYFNGCHYLDLSNINVSITLLPFSHNNIQEVKGRINEK